MRRRRLLLLAAFAGLLLAAAGAVWYFGRPPLRVIPPDGVSPHRIDVPMQTKDAGGEPPPGVRWPAEFEPQQTVWLQWPSEVYSRKEGPVAPAMAEIIVALAPYVRVNVAARSEEEIGQIRELLAGGGYTGTGVQFHVVDHLSIWARDVGPVFVRDAGGTLCVVDFGFNNYSRGGSPQYIDTENGVHRRIARLFGYPLVETGLISEGGAIESNGRGTMMTTESVALKRNPGMTKQKIEDEYKRVLGVKKVLWLKSGLAEDDEITSGHINEICRFADASTILLAEVLPGDADANDYARESRRRMEENYAILKNATDQDGKPFRIIRIPVPPTLYGEWGGAGAPPVRSYLNFAITDGAVIEQVYWKPGRSAELREAEDGVLETLRGVFPGRKVIGINAESINQWGGGIHCVTQHVPAD